MQCNHSTPSYTLKRIGNIHLHSNFDIKGHSNVIWNSQNPETSPNVYQRPKCKEITVFPSVTFIKGWDPVGLGWGTGIFEWFWNPLATNPLLSTDVRATQNTAFPLRKKVSTPAWLWQLQKSCFQHCSKDLKRNRISTDSRGNQAQ